MARQAWHHTGGQWPGIHQWQAADLGQKKRGIAIQNIQPGKLQQNAYIKRYNRTVRHEWLDQYIIEEAQGLATHWLWA